MAQGDIKTALQTVAAGSTWDVQPPSGETWMIFNILAEKNWEGTAPNKYLTHTYPKLYNGSIECPLFDNPGAKDLIKNKIIINNSIYLRFATAEAVGSRVLGYNGVEM